MITMIRCCLVFLVMVTLVSERSFAQSSVVFGHEYDNSAYEIIPATDGGFWVGGQSDVGSLGRVQYWVVRCSNQGVVMWDSVYGGDDLDFLWSIVAGKDGGVLLAGYTSIQGSGQEHALLVKVDSLGHTEKHFYGDHQPLGYHSHFFTERKQGGYFWTGHTSGQSPDGMLMQKLDSNFHKVWEKEFIHGPVTHDHCATLTNDGGCLLAGHTSISSDYLDHYYVIRTDSNGNALWKKTYVTSTSDDEAPYGVVNTRDGGFAIFGGSADVNTNLSTMWLLVIDSAGNEKINEHFGGGYSSGYSGIQCSDGGFAIIGFTDSDAAPQSQNAYVVKTDSIGHIEWQKTYQLEQPVTGYCMFQHGSHYVLAGQAGSKMWLLYTDSNGNPSSYNAPLSSVKLVTSNSSDPSLSISPEPMRQSGDAIIQLSSGLPIEHVEIFDGLGRRIRSIQPVGTTEIHWNGKDEWGQAALKGAYFVRAVTASGSYEGKIIIE